MWKKGGFMANNEMEIMELAYIKFEKEKYDEALETVQNVLNTKGESKIIFK